MLVGGGRKLFNVTHDSVSQRAGPHLAMFEKQLDESSFTEVDAFGLRRVRVDQTVGVEEKKIAALEMEVFRSCSAACRRLPSAVRPS